MQEDNSEPLPGCFGCLGDIGPLVALVLLIAFAVQRSDAAATVHPDDAVPPPLQVCAPIAPSSDAPAFSPGDDEGDIA